MIFNEQGLMDLELKKLEEELKGFAPSPLSGDVLSRMVDAMDRWEEMDNSSDDSLVESLPSEKVSAGKISAGKVVTFPVEESQSPSWRPTWAAAAAVAVLGATAAVFFPKQPNEPVAAHEGAGSVPLLRQASFVPVDAENRVSSLETGVISDKHGIPHQLIRVVRQEEASFRGADNVGMKITRPKVDYYVVPVSY